MARKVTGTVTTGVDVETLRLQCTGLRAERDHLLTVEANLRVQIHQDTLSIDKLHYRIGAALGEIDRLRRLVRAMADHMARKDQSDQAAFVDHVASSLAPVATGEMKIDGDNNRG